jgi:hypothetical protein
MDDFTDFLAFEESADWFTNLVILDLFSWVGEDALIGVAARALFAEYTRSDRVCISGSALVEAECNPLGLMVGQALACEHKGFNRWAGMCHAQIAWVLFCWLCFELDRCRRADFFRVLQHLNLEHDLCHTAGDEGRVALAACLQLFRKNSTASVDVVDGCVEITAPSLLDKAPPLITVQHAIAIAVEEDDTIVVRSSNLLAHVDA